MSGPPWPFLSDSIHYGVRQKTAGFPDSYHSCKRFLLAVTIYVAMTPTDEPHSPPQAAAIDWQAELAQHDRWLRTVIWGRLGSGAAVDDVMQEVALAAVRQQAPISDPTKVAPWLYRLAVTQTLLYRRSLGRRRKLHDRYADRYQPTERDTRSPDPLDWLLAEERRKLVREALATLPRRESEILLLKYTEDWSYKQLAEHLGTTTSAIESRLHRARTKLRQRLTAMEVIETKS